ncbi:MAG: hypothetical protein MUD08_07465 [Cytophagales bacterium]|jgi:hypothetical protein|nr:hypothetical protein [Cytophagales bacterium]
MTNELHLSESAKTTLGTGIVLLLYGYLCRPLDIRFFWESKQVGWLLTCIGITLAVRSWLRSRGTDGQANPLVQISNVIFAFMAGVQLLAMVTILVPSFDALSAAKLLLAKDPKLNREVGAISGFGWVPTSSSSGFVINEEGEYRSTTLHLTVKGERGFKDLTIHMAQSPAAPDWELKGWEPD